MYMNDVINVIYIYDICDIYIYIYICTARCNLYNGLPGQLTPVSQDSVSEADSPSAGHDPPFASTISFDLIFTRLPDPHVFEQGPNVHWLHTQSTFGTIEM